MKLQEITDWLDQALNVAAFDDVSNNGLQIARDGADVTTVAFAVDASARAVKAAKDAGAQLLVVHHGISWGGGIRRLSGGVYQVVRAAMDANIALYACHLPLDAHPALGNNAQLAKLMGMGKPRPAFSYHGNVIGFVGACPRKTILKGLASLGCAAPQIDAWTKAQSRTLTLGVCSGGAGEFAEEAKRLGCDLYLTGEANWGDVIAAQNCGMPMICAGHYETEVFGVRAVSRELQKALKLRTVDLTPIQSLREL